MIYGVESIPYNQKDLKAFDDFQIKSLRQIQHLPDRTAKVATEALLGILPVTAQIHKATLNLFYNVLGRSKSIEFEIAQRQMAVKTLSDSSFFSRARRLLLLYGLPNAYHLWENRPSKTEWKKMLNQTINGTVESKWKLDLQEKSSLKYINPESVSVGKPHYIYSTVRSNMHDIRRSEIKAKILTGTYTLQSNRSVFNQYSINPICVLCEDEAETREHFIAKCTAYEDIRKKAEEKLKLVLENSTSLQIRSILDNAGKFTQLILDCTHGTIVKEKPLRYEIEKVERLSREYLEKIHYRRCRLLSLKYV